MRATDFLERFPSAIGNTDLKVFLVGCDGQLGWELQRVIPPDQLIPVDLPAFDMTRKEQVMETVQQVQPDVIVNAAAFTSVDKAEVEKDRAFAINAEGAGNIADAAKETGARLIQISTDFVFDGTKTTPYQSDDIPAPIGVYGAGKLEGEKRVIGILQEKALIIRTAWLYSVHGVNFVKTMLRLMEAGKDVRVVCDQVGTPTWAATLARAVVSAINKPELSSIFHWTDAGVASWFDFAVAIMDEALNQGILAEKVQVLPVSSDEYHTVARRPSFCVLDKKESYLQLEMPALHWSAALKAMIADFVSTKDVI